MRTPLIFAFALATGVAVALGGCTDRPIAAPHAAVAPVSRTSPALDQGDYCFVLNYPMGMSALKTCKPGERVVFMPQQWGNEQLPIQFVSMACDLRYTVALTNGGVVCIYYRKSKAPGKPAAARLTARTSS
ncbi:MAG TPA: hypothetical protein VF284_06880 [Rhodanobacteraceae bacterium]